MQLLTVHEPRGRTSLPRLVEVEKGQSLAGALLQHELVNELSAGTLLRASRRHRTGPGHLGRPGAHLLATAFDRSYLMRLLALDEPRFESLTARTMVRVLYGAAPIQSRTLGQRLAYAICPACAAHSRILRTALFAQIWGCADHMLRSVLRCSCRATVAPFQRQRPFSCHGCGRPYAAFQQVAIVDPTEQAALISWTQIYEALLEASATEPLLLQPALRALLLLGPVDPLADRTTLYARTDVARAPVALIANILCVTGNDPDTLFSLASQPVRSVTACPNATCPGDAGFWGSARCVLICRACGTRFDSHRRVLFSFDPAPGYASWRAVRNNRRLTDLREHVAREARGGKWSAKDIFERAGVPKSLAYRTPRAGLLALIAAPNTTNGPPAEPRVDRELAAYRPRSKARSALEPAPAHRGRKPHAQRSGSEGGRVLYAGRRRA